MSASPMPSAEVRLRVEELPGFHAGMARALGQVGVGGAAQHEFFGKNVRAVCVGCGLIINGEDIGHIAVATPEAGPNTDTKLDRLRLGYCGRAGCESRFYQVTVDPAPQIEPEKLVPQALDLWKNPPAEPVVETGPKPWWQQRRNQYAVGALVAVLLLWWKFGPTEGPMAIRKEPVKYEVAPPRQYQSGSGEALQ
jgi:hypothetical protein